MNDEPLTPDRTSEHERLLIACALQDAETVLAASRRCGALPGT